MKRNFDGWRLYDNGPGYHPVTGRFEAHRWGVRLSANTEELLIEMIKMRRPNLPR